MNNIRDGDSVTWREGVRQWHGLALRVGVIHTLVRPDGGTTDWILTSKLTHAESLLRLITTDYELMVECGDYGGREG